jgi:uncharacterized protein YbjT (DUF2867 family)
MEHRSKIAVAGATGRVGHHVVDILESRGHEVVPMSRASGVDITTGEGLAEALQGVECIVDAASGPSPDQAEATEFFTAATRNLQSAGEQAGVRRIVVVSIIGCDLFSSGYNAAKVEHERLMAAGPLPATILRAAQFHEFVEQLVDWGTHGDVSYVPAMRTQLVAARTVAEALAELATSPDWAVAPGRSGETRFEIAGPREERLVDAGRLLAAQRGRPARVEDALGDSDPDQKLFETGGLLPGPNARLAGPTFEEWLRAAVPVYS